MSIQYMVPGFEPTTFGTPKIKMQEWQSGSDQTIE